jgi:hypothetical protein
LQDATYVGCQTGYFSFDGIFPLEAEFLNLLGRSGTLRLVVGANESGIRRVDLEDMLDLFERGSTTATTSLTLVAADDVLMHPKTYYVEKADGTKHALVGSANLTHSGLSRNIEASLVIDSVNDPGAPFAEIRAALENWHATAHPNAYPVTRAALRKLVTDGIIDQPARVRPAQSPKARQKRARAFPPLGAMLRLPRKKRPVAPTSTVSRPKAVAPVPMGTLGTLPNGAVGIIKRLSKLDVKGFKGGTGTLYIALPNALVPHLPMTPYGRNNTPRTDVAVEARLDSVGGEIVLSGSSPTNITHEGAGTSGSSHRDLRLNYLIAVKRGIEDVARAYGVNPPDEDDLVAIELLDGIILRLTFLTDPASITSLSPLLDQRDNSWGWLPPGVVAPWADEEDA